MMMMVRFFFDQEPWECRAALVLLLPGLSNPLHFLCLVGLLDHVRSQLRGRCCRCLGVRTVLTSPLRFPTLEGCLPRTVTSWPISGGAWITHTFSHIFTPQLGSSRAMKCFTLSNIAPSRWTAILSPGLPSTTLQEQISVRDRRPIKSMITAPFVLRLIPPSPSDRRHEVEPCVDT